MLVRSICFTAAFFVPLVAAADPRGCETAEGLRSFANDRSGTLTIINRRQRPIKTFWVDFDGRRHSFGTVVADGIRTHTTKLSHFWVLTDEDGQCLRVVVVTKPAEELVLEDETGPSTCSPSDDEPSCQ